MQGTGFRVQGAGFRVPGSGFGFFLRASTYISGIGVPAVTGGPPPCILSARAVHTNNTQLGFSPVVAVEINRVMSPATRV